MKSWLTPIFLLAAILAAAALNCRAMEQDVTRWQSQLKQVEAQAAAENWPGAQSLLSKSYADWSSHQTYLHITVEHDVVDNGNTMYRRAVSFAASEEKSEFLAELAELTYQLSCLSEMERFSVKNVL